MRLPALMRGSIRSTRRLRRRRGEGGPPGRCQSWKGSAGLPRACVDERDREAGNLAALKAERASLAAKGRQAEIEAAPIPATPIASGQSAG
jgi:hypothetical protein